MGWHIIIKTDQKKNIYIPLRNQKLMSDLTQECKADTSSPKFSWNYEMYFKIKRYQSGQLHMKKKNMSPHKLRNRPNFSRHETISVLLL